MFSVLAAQLFLSSLGTLARPSRELSQFPEFNLNFPDFPGVQSNVDSYYEDSPFQSCSNFYTWPKDSPENDACSEFCLELESSVCYFNGNSRNALHIICPFVDVLLQPDFKSKLCSDFNRDQAAKNYFCFPECIDPCDFLDDLSTENKLAACAVVSWICSKDCGGALSDGVNNLADGARDVGGAIVDGVSDAGEAIVDGVSDAGEAIVDGVSNLGNAVGSIFG